MKLFGLFFAIFFWGTLLVIALAIKLTLFSVGVVSLLAILFTYSVFKYNAGKKDDFWAGWKIGVIIVFLIVASYCAYDVLK